MFEGAPVEAGAAQKARDLRVQWIALQRLLGSLILGNDPLPDIGAGQVLERAKRIFDANPMQDVKRAVAWR